ncbi:MAG TPA: peptidase E [Gaiellales bacterium]|jgi:peptidase E
MADRHIVAMGGGGFLMEGAESLLDAYVLALTDRPNPRVCYLGTAMGDAAAHIVGFYRAFPLERADATHLALFERDGRDPRDHLLAQDVVYVGGGNTVNMLAVWRAHGVDAALREAWEAGVVLCGMSAGSLCWFEAGVTDSYGPLRPLHDGLGLLPGSHCPHYDGEAERRPTYRRAIADGLPPGIAADDCCALHFSGTELVEVVASRPDACAYRVEPGPLGAVETPIAARFLGA